MAWALCPSASGLVRSRWEARGTRPLDGKALLGHYGLAPLSISVLPSVLAVGGGHAPLSLAGKQRSAGTAGLDYFSYLDDTAMHKQGHAQALCVSLSVLWGSPCLAAAASPSHKVMRIPKLFLCWQMRKQRPTRRRCRGGRRADAARPAPAPGLGGRPGPPFPVRVGCAAAAGAARAASPHACCVAQDLPCAATLGAGRAGLRC